MPGKNYYSLWKVYGQIQGGYKQLELWCQTYTYIASGLEFRTFQVLGFCCTVYIFSFKGKINR